MQTEHVLFLSFSPGWQPITVSVHILQWSPFFMNTQIHVPSSMHETFTLPISEKLHEFQPALAMWAEGMGIKPVDLFQFLL